MLNSRVKKSYFLTFSSDRVPEFLWFFPLHDGLGLPVGGDEGGDGGGDSGLVLRGTLNVD